MTDQLEGAIALGADALDRDGAKLGVISRMIANAGVNLVTEVVIKHGLLLTHERIAPLPLVRGVSADGVRFDLSEAERDQLSGFAEARRAADPDYVGPPPADAEGTYRGNLAFDALVAQAGGAGLGFGGKPLGYPGGERLAPDSFQRPVIEVGTAVLARDGEQVGEVAALAVTLDGRLAALTVRQGTLLRREGALPLDWIDSLGTGGVLLRAPAAEVEALLA